MVRAVAIMSATFVAVVANKDTPAVGDLFTQKAGSADVTIMYVDQTKKFMNIATGEDKLDKEKAAAAVTADKKLEKGTELKCAEDWGKVTSKTDIVDGQVYKTQTVIDVVLTYTDLKKGEDKPTSVESVKYTEKEGELEVSLTDKDAKKVTVKCSKKSSPFYCQWWFFAIVAVVLILIIVGVVFALKSKKEEEVESEDESSEEV